MRKFRLFILTIFRENSIWSAECAGLILTVWLLFSPAFSKLELSKPWSLLTVLILFIQEFISSLNSYIQKTLTCHFLYNCKTVLSSWTLFHGRNFLLSYFHKLEIIWSNHWKLVWKGLLSYWLPYCSSLSFSFNDSIPFASITESHFMFSCSSSADFKMANSTTYLSPLSFVCCCFLGTRPGPFFYLLVRVWHWSHSLRMT